MPNFTQDNFKDRVERLSQGSQETLRELIIDALLEGSSCRFLEKSTFLFGDQITVPDKALYVDEHKWFQKIEGV